MRIDMQVADARLGLAGQVLNARNWDGVVAAAHDRDRPGSKDGLCCGPDALVQLRHAGARQSRIATVDDAPIVADVNPVFERGRSRVLAGRLPARLWTEHGPGPLRESLRVDRSAEKRRASSGLAERLGLRLAPRCAEEGECFGAGPDVSHL